MGITYGDHLIDSGYHDITPEQEREIEAREECARRGIDPDVICADGGVEAWMVVAQEIAARPLRVVPELLAAHAQFGGDLEDMQRRYDAARPDAWQWRFKLESGEWSDWNDGKAREWVINGDKEYQERPLYAAQMKTSTAMALSAMCHREKWQFEGTAAFDVLHRIGELCRSLHSGYEQGRRDANADGQRHVDVPSPGWLTLADFLDPETAIDDRVLREVHLDLETRGRKNADFMVTVHHRNIVLSAAARAVRKTPAADRISYLEAKLAKALEALAFYANPVIYKPHPHGLAFDRRDLSFLAKSVLEGK